MTFNDSKYNNINGTFKGKEKEKDIIFSWIKKEDLKKYPIKPDYVVNQILTVENKIKITTCIE